MNAKIIFGIIDSFGEGNFEEFSIYSIKNEFMSESEESYRVDCADKGSFEISKLDGQEEYNLKSDTWIFVYGITYSFNCLSTTYAGYPILTMKDVVGITGMKQYIVVKDYCPIITKTTGKTEATDKPVLLFGDVLTQMGKNDLRFISSKNHDCALYEYTIHMYKDCFKQITNPPVS